MDDTMSVAGTEYGDNLRWVPHPTDVWCVATVGDTPNAKGELECEVVDMQGDVAASAAPEVLWIPSTVIDAQSLAVEEAHLLQGAQDVTKLYGTLPHQGPALTHFKNMFNTGVVYCRVQEVLVSVNPCRQLPAMCVSFPFPFSHVT